MNNKQHISYPVDNKKVTLKRLKSGTYIYFETGRTYNPTTQHTTPNRVCIGKLDKDDEKYMFPNDKYFDYFPAVSYEEDDAAEDFTRSCALSVGSFIAIKKIIERLKLDLCLQKAITDPVARGLFLDFATYEIIEMKNVAQHFPGYAFRHPLFTPEMCIVSDSTLCALFANLTVDQRQMFLNEWNTERNKRERIYISYDSTNRHTKAGEIEEAEYGKAKDGVKDPIINQGIAYDCDNREPLFYESYPGSIVDVSMLEFMVNEAQAYGYRDIGFILDRGYFSKANLFYMDRHNNAFIIMVKGSSGLPLLNNRPFFTFFPLRPTPHLFKEASGVKEELKRAAKKELQRKRDEEWQSWARTLRKTPERKAIRNEMC